MLNIKKWEEIRDGLYLIESAKPKYSTAKFMGYTKEGVEKAVMKAVFDAHDLINEMIDRAEFKYQKSALDQDIEEYVLRGLSDED